MEYFFRSVCQYSTENKNNNKLLKVMGVFPNSRMPNCRQIVFICAAVIPGMISRKWRWKLKTILLFPLGWILSSERKHRLLPLVTHTPLKQTQLSPFVLSTCIKMLVRKTEESQVQLCNSAGPSSFRSTETLNRESPTLLYFQCYRKENSFVYRESSQL